MYRQRFTVINIIKYLQISKNNTKKNKWNTPINNDGQAVFIRNTSDHWTYGNSFNPTTTKSKLKWQRYHYTHKMTKMKAQDDTRDCVILISRRGKTGAVRAHWWELKLAWYLWRAIWQWVWKTFKNLRTHWASIYTSRNFSYKIIHMSGRRYTWKDVHGSIVCNSKNKGGKIHQWGNRQETVAQPCNRVSQSWLTQWAKSISHLHGKRSRIYQVRNGAGSMILTTKWHCLSEFLFIDIESYKKL